MKGVSRMARRPPLSLPASDSPESGRATKGIEAHPVEEGRVGGGKVINFPARQEDAKGQKGLRERTQGGKTNPCRASSRSDSFSGAEV